MPDGSEVIVAAVSTHQANERPGIEARGVTVRYGGLVAADGVDLRAPLGHITGLIGPNGAGKTTTFAACSGMVAPSQGTVHLFGKDVTKLPAQTRGQRGLGRTFQRMELFDSLTVADNVGLGLEAGLAGSLPWRHLFGSRGDAARIAERVQDSLRRCGLTELADTPAGELSTGQGRLVELARVMAGDFRMLLLDEPSSGLDRTETARFGAILRELVEQTGKGILLVEHDMSLVLNVCDYVYVLDFGKLIFEGTAAQIVASHEVQAAYLGAEDVKAGH